jgi:energy-converting hydrogenase A subunit M
MDEYRISREAFETFVRNQARMHKAAADKADEATLAGDRVKAARYVGEAAAREDVVSELAKYLNVSEEEIGRIWEEGTQ